MKRNNYILVFVTIFSVFSCAKEENIPVVADFEIIVVNNDYSIPVTVEIKNKTVGADTYLWSFNGSTILSSSDRNPAPITYLTKGTYKIILKATNKDGSEDTKSIDIQIDNAIKTDFEWTMLGSDISPVTLQMVNKTQGAMSYRWSFQDGEPATSTDATPSVKFTSAGEHLITLTATNGRETYLIEKRIIVKPAMVVDFAWSVDFIDSDYEAPVLLHLDNKSINATAYEWTVQGATLTESSAVSPNLFFPNSGVYTILLKASNDKETKTVEKQLAIRPDKNLLSFTNIKLGISIAHSTIGSFFSSYLGKVITRNEVTAETGAKIDFGYFGLNNNFSFNQFLSPDEVETTSFLPIPAATHTRIVNSQELANTQLAPSQFDNIDNGAAFSNITISENLKGKSPFTNEIIPRVVLFQKADGTKGAIKIKEFVSDEKNSYILTDIKVQKRP